MPHRDKGSEYFVATLCVCVLIFVAIAFFGYYQAGVQADVYRRQGFNISTWEVMMGGKPIERVITIK